MICPIRPETPVFPAHLKDRIPSSVSSISYLLHLNDLKSIPTDKDSSWKDMMFGEAWPTVSEGVSSDELMSNSCREIHDSPAESLAGMAESQNLEFKSSVWHAYQKPLNPNLSPQEVSKGIQEAVIKTICGFMNSEGGTLLVGVDDQNTVLGLEGDFKSKVIKDIDDYELRLIRLLSDNLGRPNVAEFVRLSFPLVNGNEICRIDVKPSTAPVFSKREKFYVRVSNATNSLLPSETLTYCIGHWGY